MRPRHCEGKVMKPLWGHAYHNKTDVELRFIIKDAGEAAQAVRGLDEKAEGKYLDQVNDACTVLGWRSAKRHTNGRRVGTQG